LILSQSLTRPERYRDAEPLRDDALETERTGAGLDPLIAPLTALNARASDVGALVQADAASGTFLFTLMQTDVLRIQLYVPQDQAFGVAPGVGAVVRVPEIPGRDFPGQVTRIADALQPGTRTLLTEIDVPNTENALQPGVYCNVELKIPRKTPSLIVPSEAIVFNRHGLNVAVVENGVVHIRQVNVVRDFGTSVEVNAGVNDGDQVVLNPPVDLTDGRKVQIRPAPPAQMSQNHDSNSIGGSPQKSLSASRWRSPYVPPSNQSPAVSVSVS